MTGQMESFKTVPVGQVTAPLTAKSSDQETLHPERRRETCLIENLIRKECHGRIW